MEWFPSSLDVNSIEKLQFIIDRDIYKDAKQYPCKNLWEARKTIVSNVKIKTVGKLTRLLIDRLMKVIEDKGVYINM